MAKIARFRWQGLSRKPTPAPVVARRTAPRAPTFGSKHRPPTKRQLEYLVALARKASCEPPTVRTSRQASDAIEALKAGAPERGASAM